MPSPVAAFLLGPRVDDLSILQNVRKMGLRPKATALILNLGRVDAGVDADAAFGLITRHSVFRAAVDDGAQVIRMPRLDPIAAQAIEARRLHFDDLQGKIAPFDALAASAWLKEMEVAFRPIESWMPWAK
ncbi:MAG: hypothetical protein JOY71_26805 [Acetobacteraceae bacterium]|nr:hypothetical protein [Acetobacteraceae bacterium]